MIRPPRDILAALDALELIEDSLRMERRRVREIVMSWHAIRPDDFSVTRLPQIQTALDATQLSLLDVDRELRSTVDFVRELASGFAHERQLYLQTGQPQQPQQQAEQPCGIVVEMWQGVAVATGLVGLLAGLLCGLCLGWLL